jgi:exodeoxyribonuclease VII large subunit
MMKRGRFREIGEQRALMRISDAIRRREQRLDELSARLLGAQNFLLQSYRRRLDLAAVRVRHHDLRRVFQGMRRDLQGLSAQLPRAMQRALFTRRARWQELHARLQALSPLNILERGYAVVFSPEGKPVTDSDQVALGDDLSIRLAKGSLGAKVVSREK